MADETSCRGRVTLFVLTFLFLAGGGLFWRFQSAPRAVRSPGGDPRTHLPREDPLAQSDPGGEGSVRAAAELLLSLRTDRRLATTAAADAVS